MATEVTNATIPLSSVSYGVQPRDSSRKSQSLDSQTAASKAPDKQENRQNFESTSINLPPTSGLNSFVAQQAASLDGEDEGKLPKRLSDETSDDRLESADDAQAERTETAPRKAIDGEEEQAAGPEPEDDEPGQPQKLSEKEVGALLDKDETGEPKKLFSDDEQDEQLVEERKKEQAAYLNEGLTKLYSRGSNLYGADLSGQNLAGGQFSKADFRQASLVGVSLSGADLRNADFSGADLTGADLSGANLSGANFTGAFIANANLSGASGAKYDGSGKLTLDRATTLSRIDLTA